MFNTMAVKITKKTYPIAVACLPAGFAGIPFSRVKGSYLIINKPEPLFLDDQGYRPFLTLTNSWLSKEIFFREYEFIGKEVKNVFTPIVKIEPVPVSYTNRPRVRYGPPYNPISPSMEL